LSESATVTLDKGLLRIDLTPAQGCDITALIDRRSGVDVLFKTPWGASKPGVRRHAPDSMTAWLDAYPGGWQVLVPNGGDACDAGGVEWGFHGEASQAPWDVLDAGADHLTAAVELARAPLRLTRTIRLLDRRMLIVEEVCNRSPDPVEFMWSHHPAFGPPFLEPGCLVAAGATTLTADPVHSGNDLGLASEHEWPVARRPDGTTRDYSRLTQADGGTSTMAYLGGFSDGWYSIVNPRLRLGVGLTWPADVFPHAWLWQELQATAAWPWYRQAYVMAIEPASSVPGHGIAGVRRSNGNLMRLEGHASQQVEIEAVLFDADHTPAHLAPGGHLTFPASERAT
jgi:hypothetical protein